MTLPLDGRFGQLSPEGRLACGAVTISIDGVAIGPGTTPIWRDARRVVYTRQPDGAMMEASLGQPPRELQPPAHEPSSLCASASGILAWREKDGIHTSDGRFIEGAFRPAWAGEDLCWCIDTGTTADLYREGVLVARTVHDVRGTREGVLAYIQVAGPSQWTCLSYPGGGSPTGWRLAGAEEYRPKALWWRGEQWVLSHTRDDRLLLRSGNNGIVVATGATYEPDAVVLPGDNVRVTWADERGAAREVFLTPTVPTIDLRPSTPMDPAAPWPPGSGWLRRRDIQTIDMVEWLLGSQPWSRDGMHIAGDGVTYSHPFQSRAGSGWVQHTKFAPPDTRSATWTFSKEWIGLAYDGTNELGESAVGRASGYRYVLPGTFTTAALYPRMMRVGVEHAREVALEVLDLRDGSRRPIRWKGWVEAVYEATVPVGSFPAGTLHAVVAFVPQPGDPATWNELNICTRGQGCWYWHRQKQRTQVIDMRWIGTLASPRIPEPSPLFADATPQEHPPMSLWVYNDVDAKKVIDFLEVKYLTPPEQGGLGRDAVDNLGYARWLHDAVRLLDSGRSIDAALREINRRINTIVGLPLDAWPGEVPAPVDPS